MAATTRPNRPALSRRWDARREELIAAAAETFAARGYAETSMAQLAASLGVATGSVYHYFEGKEGLLLAICDELTDPLLAAARELPAEGSAEDRFAALVQLWVGHVVAHRHHLLVFTQVRHVVDAGGPEWRGVRDARKQFEQLLAEALEGCRVADPALRRLALLGMVNHLPQWYRPRGRLRPAEIADGWVALALA